MKEQVKIILVTMSFLGLSSCSYKSDIENTLDEYRARLARVLDIEFPAINKTQSNPLAKTDLKVDVPKLEINLREFYGINHCELALIIAQRNTALGKAQLPSQRLIYERKLLRAFDSCATEIEDLEPELSNKLESLKQQKLSTYAVSWAYFFQQSNEIYSAFNRSSEFINAENTTRYQISIQDWNNLSKLASLNDLNEGKIDEQIETILERIAQNRLPASLWASEEMLSHYFESLNHSLEDSLASVECKDGVASNQANILRNVFVMFFVEKVQPVGSQINQIQYQLQPVLNELANHVIEPSMRDHLTKNSIKNFDEYRANIKRHVEIWQIFLNRCNLVHLKS